MGGSGVVAQPIGISPPLLLLLRHVDFLSLRFLFRIEFAGGSGGGPRGCG